MFRKINVRCHYTDTIEECFLDDNLSLFVFICYRKIHLHIPKFSISGTYDVKRIVKQVGMIDLFTEQADLSGITEEPGLMVSKVSQHMKHSNNRICLFPGTWLISHEKLIPVSLKHHSIINSCQSGGKASPIFPKPEAKHAYKGLYIHSLKTRKKTYV